MSEATAWDFWIDRGGTFTDVVASDPAGRLHLLKLLSDDPDHYADAALEAIRRLLGAAGGAAIEPARIGSVRMGTTVATNALLTRTGAPTCLVVTKGFADLLAIGYQDRPDLFALKIDKPAPLPDETLEVDHRVLADGTVRRDLDPERVRADLAAARARGARSAAVVLLHSYAHPDHERRVGCLAREAGFEHVSLSHEVGGEIKAVARAGTTSADAYLTPILRGYVGGVRRALGPGVDLRFMQSHGGLAEADRFSGVAAILSGPAGGVVAAAHVAALAGLEKVITFDMGGTSTDVSRHDGAAGGFPRVFEKVAGGVRIQAPMLDIHTVAAGGGSVLHYADGRMRVGPDSAGAEPGPACYRRGGPATVTDANAVLGRIQPRHFPACFGPHARQTIDPSAARAALEEIAGRIATETRRAMSAEDAAAGFVRIANENMARAIRAISVARGCDPREYALVCFGGAGPQHACAIAESLGMRKVLLHPLAGVLSAYGLGLADNVLTDVRAVLAPLGAAAAKLAGRFADVEAGARRAMREQGFADERIVHLRSLDLRYAGTEAYLNVPLIGGEDPRAAFEAAHRRMFGFAKPGADVEVVNLRVETRGRTPKPDEPAAPAEPHDVVPSAAIDAADVHFDVLGPDGARRLEAIETPIFRRRDLRPGARVAGPAIVVEEASTIVVDPHWRGEVNARGHLLLSAGGPGRAERVSAECDPVLLEVFNNRFMSIAEQMGITLRKVSHSTNIKERLDFSCAVFDGRGELVANAQHIPVHLGAMGDSVRAVIAARAGDLRDGDVYVTNDPYHGGTHLPDVTVITPVFPEAPDRPRGGESRDAGDTGDAITEKTTGRGSSASPPDRPRGGKSRDAGDTGDVAFSTTESHASPASLPDPSPAMFFVASRGHHADIGGATPGSMPPDSATIDEEGVLIRDFRLVRKGRLAEAEFVELLSAGAHPARNLPERLSDVRAAIAANAAGAALLKELVEAYGPEVVAAYMRHVSDNAERAMRAVLAELPDGDHRFADRLDDGTPVAVNVRIAGDRAVVDFAGTGDRHPGNLNAPRAVVAAAVLYVFRTLIPRPVPLNAGCLRPIEIRVPAGSLLDPRPPAAVAGGNVETSMRITDVLYGALGALSAGQGTMNNVTFGTPEWTYYETICGGEGAGLGFDGADAVHSRMTNTRGTDPEVIERRYPVVLRSFRIRRGSGGSGVWRGGHGAVREIEFLRAMSAAVLSERRAAGPFGLHGAGAGQRGRNRLVRGGRSEDLPGKVKLTVQAGDVLVVETPGGGGYDPSPAQWAAMPPTDARRLFRLRRYAGPTVNISAGHVQANLVVLPTAAADDFEAYCRANPRPCPLLERLAPGDPRTHRLAPGADVRTDLPRYRLHLPGRPAVEAPDATAWWRDDLTAFLLGCSFSFDEALADIGLTPRHVEQGVNVPMYRTGRDTTPAGPFAGKLVVTMRPVPAGRVDDARAATARFERVHGPPIHHGDPSALGIGDLSRPDWGEPVDVRPGEVPVFWACGVTSHVAVRTAIDRGAIDLAITHAPGHMFIADPLNADLAGP